VDGSTGDLINIFRESPDGWDDILHPRFSADTGSKPCVQYTPLSQWSVYGHLVDDEFIVPADVIKDCRLRWITDGGLVEFHLDSPDARKIMRVDLPFSAFTVAFEEVTTPRNPNEVPERVGLLWNPVAIPCNIGDTPLAEGRLHDLYVSVI
jgi:hypothetical protein